jgi:PAS domain-containing protein
MIWRSIGLFNVVMIGLCFSAFMILYPVFGPPTFVLVTLPIAIIAWRQGLRAGIAASFASVLITLLLSLANDTVYPIYIILTVPFLALALMLGRLRDVTTQLQHTQERYQVLYERLPDAVLLLDPNHPNVEWAIVDCNEAAEHMNGYRREEMIGQSIELINAEKSDGIGPPKQCRSRNRALASAQGWFSLSNLCRHLPDSAGWAGICIRH